jgi:hypothetical protein
MVRLSSAPVALPPMVRHFPTSIFAPHTPDVPSKKKTRPPHHSSPPQTDTPSSLQSTAAPCPGRHRHTTLACRRIRRLFLRPPPLDHLRSRRQCCAPTCRPSSPDAIVHRPTDLPPPLPPIVAAPHPIHHRRLPPHPRRGLPPPWDL